MRCTIRYDERESTDIVHRKKRNGNRLEWEGRFGGYIILEKQKMLKSYQI